MLNDSSAILTADLDPKILTVSELTRFYSHLKMIPDQISYKLYSANTFVMLRFMLLDLPWEAVDTPCS